MKPKDSITVIDTIPPNSSESYTHTFAGSGVIEDAVISTHLGQEYGLRYKIHLHKEDGEHTITLFNPLGQPFVAGNGSDFHMPVRREFSKGDELEIHVENTTQHEYHINFRAAVDRAGGVLGVLSKIGSLKEVFN